MERKINWQAEQDCDTFLSTAKIRKVPKRFKVAQALARQQLSDMKKIARQHPTS